MKTRLLVVLLSLVFLGSASAGVLKVQDEDQILTDQSDLQVAVASAPFDVLVVASVRAPNKADFDHYIDGLVPGAGWVVVGLDIAKHHSHAIAGPWVRTSGRAITAACDKGNPYFKDRKYGQGLGRIVTEIALGVQPVSAAPIPGTVAPSGLQWEWVLLGGLAFGVVIWGMIWIVNRRRRQEQEDAREARENQRKDYFSGGEYRQPFVTPPPDPWTVPYPSRTNVVSPQAPSTSTIIVDRESNSGLVDLMAMDMIINRPAPVVIVEPPAPAYRAPDPIPTPDPPSYSSGSSDYSSSDSGSSGGGDFGGGGGGFDGGSSGGGDW